MGMKIDRKFGLTLLTLALAGSLCACSGTTTEATPTPDSTPSDAPKNPSGVVGYGYNGYNGYNRADGGMWDADPDTTWDVGDAARRAADDVGDAARGAANGVRRGVNDMARDVERATENAW